MLHCAALSAVTEAFGKSGPLYYGENVGDGFWTLDVIFSSMLTLMMIEGIKRNRSGWRLVKTSSYMAVASTLVLLDESMHLTLLCLDLGVAPSS